MTSETATNPNRLTVPTAREIRDALASIPTGKGEPGLNSAILGVAEGARFASRALLHIFPAARGSDAEAPIKAALFALSTTANAFEDCARELVLDMEAERSEMIADGRGADYLDMRGER